MLLTLVMKSMVSVIVAVSATAMVACSGEAVGDGKGTLRGGLLGDATNGQGSPGAAQGTRTGDPSAPTAPTGGTTNSGPAPSTPTTGKACYASGSSGCDACVNAKCCGAINACAANAQCAALYDCLSMCTDGSCESYCAQQYPSGVSLYQSASQCVRTTCGGSCAG